MKRCSLKIALVVPLIAASGCATQHSSARLHEATVAASQVVTLASHQADPPHPTPELGEPFVEPLLVPLPPTLPDLTEMEAEAEASNPMLRRMWQEVVAAEARVGYVGSLPDPTLGTNVFGHPIETAAGSQRANLTMMQMLPWLHRLDAQTQQACLEAMALQHDYESERLRVIADVRTAWYQLFVLEKQIETTRVNQELLQSLIDAAVATIATGRGSASDVRLGTVEYSMLEERRLRLEQQLASTKATLNRLLGRSSDSAIDPPAELDVDLPDWSPDELWQSAWENQPALAAAQVRTQATQWGLEIARLKRRPDFSLSASWFAMEDNRPPSARVDIGRDAWSLGAQMTIPLWHEKYDSIENEAAWKHAASHSMVEEVRQRYDALLLDLWAQAQTAHETAVLYQQTILPEAKRSLEVDTEGYANGTADFDRVVRGFRTVLTLELGYHQAVGQLATALARIEQATGGMAN